MSIEINNIYGLITIVIILAILLPRKQKSQFLKALKEIRKMITK
ncbi:hypothetical protein [Parvicella tangerina]|nr:hypothetical protein [Parvicella tangerina]